MTNRLKIASWNINSVRARIGLVEKLILAFLRDGNAPGGLRLYGWTAVDAQGKSTVVKLSNQRYNVAVPPSAFTYTEPKKRGK